MKQDWEEKAIRQLFRDERQADESDAPHFSATLEAALSRRRTYRPGRLIFRFAFALVALVAVIGVIRFILIPSGGEQPAIVAQEPIPPDNTTPAPMIVELTQSPKKAPPSTVAGTRRHRQTPPRQAALISQWRSPTDFLLRTPGDQLLKTVPSVGTSAFEIRINFSDQKN